MNGNNLCQQNMTLFPFSFTNFGALANGDPALKRSFLSVLENGELFLYSKMALKIAGTCQSMGCLGKNRVHFQ